MANTRRRSQRGGDAHMQNAGPAPNKPTAPVMPAAMGGRRSRGGAYNMMKPATGGRPPPSQFMPGATAAAAPPTSQQLMDYVNKCKEADPTVKAARDVIAADPPLTFTPQKSQQAQLQAQRATHAQALAQAISAAESKCRTNATGLTTSTIDAAAAVFAPAFVPAEGGGRSRRHRGGRPPVVMPAESTFVPAEGGRRRGGKTRKASPWNLFVKKIYGEMKRKHGKGASFSDALKEASRRKKEM